MAAWISSSLEAPAMAASATVRPVPLFFSPRPNRRIPPPERGGHPPPLVTAGEGAGRSDRLDVPLEGIQLHCCFHPRLKQVSRRQWVARMVWTLGHMRSSMSRIPAVEFPEWNCGRLAARGRMENWTGSLRAWRVWGGESVRPRVPQEGTWRSVLFGVSLACG